jgi:hypothetical protein
MAWFSTIPLLGTILDKLIPDKNKKLDRAIAEIDRDKAVMAEIEKGKNTKHFIVLEETRGNFLQRSWRPLLVYVFLLVLINNVLVVPAASYYFGVDLLILVFPENVPDFITYAITGYMGARTIEKLAEKA